MKHGLLVALCLACAIPGAPPAPVVEAATARANSPVKASLPAGVLARVGPMRYVNLGRVLTVAFAPDGRTLAAGCWDGAVWLGDVAGRKIVRQWQAHDGMVRSLAFSADGKVLASATTKGEVRLWQGRDGRPLKTLPQEGEPVLHLGFSPDGKYLAARGYRELKVWDWARGTVVCALKPRSGNQSGLPPGSAPFAADGATLAYVSDNTLEVVETATGKVMQRSALAGWWYQVLSPTGGYLARYEMRSDRDVPRFSFQVWDRAAGRQCFQATVHWVFDCLAFANDERSIALADGTNKMILYEVATGQVRKELTSADKGEVCLAWSPDGKMLATGSVDQSVLLWDLAGQANGGTKQGPALTANALEDQWKELAVRDGRRSYAALWDLVGGGKDSVSFLARKLAPPAADAQRLAELLRDLSARSFTVRDRAVKELENLGETAEPALRQCLKENSSLETRRRVEDLLRRIDVRWLQTNRALEALECLGIPQARQVLEHLAQANPQGRLSQEAGKSLRRLRGRGGD